MQIKVEEYWELNGNCQGHLSSIRCGTIDQRSFDLSAFLLVRIRIYQVSYLLSDGRISSARDNVYLPSEFVDSNILHGGGNIDDG